MDSSLDPENLQLINVYSLFEIMQAERILVGCAVKENNAEYANLETEYLFKTLTKFGGNLANVKKIACFTEKPTLFFEEILKNLQVKIQINNKLDERQSFANKIRIEPAPTHYHIRLKKLYNHHHLY